MKMKNNEIIIMNFSGIYRSESFYDGENVTWVEVQGLLGSNCYCDEEAMIQIREKIQEFSAEGIHFIDSGNYHYMSRIWLEKITQPFRLLVFDNHTDMQPPAFGGILSCGGWIAAAVEELPLLKEVVLCGPDEESFGQVPEEWTKKVRFLSREKCRVWRQDENASETVMKFFSEIPTDLPLYVSVDKDVLCEEDACTTWSQGDMRLSELLEYLDAVLHQFADAGQEIAGIDICGECDPDQNERSEVNDKANSELLKLINKCKRDRHSVDK